jgi:ribonucleoside-diphosphate reductase alpha chain
VSLRHKFDVGEVEGYLHIGLYDDGMPGEVFITGVKQGSTISGLLDGIAILTSLALQRGVPLEEMVSKLQGTKFEPSGLTKSKDIPMATSLLDYIFRYVQLRCNGEAIPKLEFSGMVCPSCGASVRFQEGCMHCAANCGWSRC